MRHASTTFRAVFLSYASLMFLGLGDNIRGPLFPEILNQFAISNTEGSLFFGLSSIAAFSVGLLAHRIESRWGLLPTLRISVFVMLASQVSLGLSPSFPFLLLSSLVFGASLGVLGVLTNVLVVRAMGPGPQRNKILSGLHGMYAGASLLAPMIVGFIATLNMQYPIWRMGFTATTLFGLVVFAFSFWKVDLAEPEKDLTHQPVPAGQGLAQIYFAVILASYVLCEVMVSSRMALYLRTEFHASVAESSWYTAGFFICLFVGRILFTIWTPEMKVKSQLITSLLLSIACLIVGIYFHPMGLVIAGFCMGPFYPMMMVSIGHVFPRSVSVALGWAVSMGSLFVVLMHFIVGYITDAYSLKTALYLGPAFCTLSLGMLVFYAKIFRRLQHQF